MAPATRTVVVPARVYRQHDADLARDVPAEGFDGWTTVGVPLDLDRTALVSMHAWDCKGPDQVPGWYRHVEYLPRAARTLDEVFPPLLDAARRAGLPVFHVAGGGKYYQHLDGFRAATRAARRHRRPWPWPTGRAGIPRDAGRRELDRIREAAGGCGERNRADIARAFESIDFAPQARPLDGEGIADDAATLLALCKAHRVSHLIYTGFALNWCLLASPGGMIDMSRLGLLCSTIPEATTAVEHKETARDETCKAIALWRVSLAFGFVFPLEAFVAALHGASSHA